MSAGPSPLKIFNYQKAISADSNFFDHIENSVDEVDSLLSPTDRASSDFLCNATGCCHIKQFKERLLGNLEPFSIEKSVINIILFNTDQKYLDVTLYIHDKDNNYAGIMLRKMFPNESRVVHELFKLEEKYRNKGKGSLIYQSQEESWRCAGYKYVEVVAGKEMGGYVWAINGYDYYGDMGEQAKKRHVSFINTRLHNLYVQGYISERSKVILEMAAEKIQFPWRVAIFEIPEEFLLKPLGDSDRHIGKLALKEIEWHGYKELSDDWHGNEVSNRTRIFRLPK